MQNTDREALNSVIKEILAEDSTIVKDAIKEIIAEKQSLQDAQKQREDELSMMMNKHFDVFDDVFKALA